MNTLKTLLTFTILSIAVSCQRQQYSDIVAKINSMHASWVAELSPSLNYDDTKALTGRLGAILGFVPTDKPTAAPAPFFVTSTTAAASVSRPRKLQTATVITSVPVIAPVSAYPASLDLRAKFPQCTSISLVRNQGYCGSCWAFSALNSLSDRFCIRKSTPLSVQQKFFSAGNVLECCATCNGGSGNGCYGGIPYYAFKHAQDTGVVSGETILLNGFCKPYYLELKQDYTMTAPQCTTTCTNPKGYAVPYALDLYKSAGTVFGSGETQMIAALNNGGSVAAAFTVYQDFYAYKSGVYRHLTGAALGGHAVRLIGYGVDNGIKFWLVANSWGKYWGESGFFRILRGSDDCGIESNYFAAGIIN